MIPKGSQNRCQNRHFGDQGSDFWGFGACFWAGVFFIIFFIYHRSFPVVQNNAMDYTFEALFGMTWVTFWHHLGDFGRHFGTSWAPRGSQNRPFWHQVAPKTQKMSPRMRHQKMYENLIEIWWKKWRFWMCSSHRTTMYKGILVVGAFYDKIKKLIKKVLAAFFRFLVAFV